MKSHINVHCRLVGIPWLSETETARLLLIERALRYDDLGSGRCRRPLLLSHITTLIKTLGFNDGAQLLLATTLLLGHDGLLRGGKIWSGLKAVDVL